MMSKYGTALSLLPALQLLSGPRGVDGHALELLSCFTTDGDLRVFVRHWHTASSGAIEEPTTVADVGGMTIDGAVVDEPAGLINDVPAASLDAPWSDLFATGCCTPVVQETICPDNAFPAYAIDSYVWYDFPAPLGITVSHTFEQGMTETIREGCDELYPTTVEDTFRGCPPDDPDLECLGCNFMSTVLDGPVASGAPEDCGLEMDSVSIEGSSGRCHRNLFDTRECAETHCSSTVTVKIRHSGRCERCTLSIYDGPDRVLWISPQPSDEFLKFSYEARSKCECHTHRIKVVFSCPGRKEDYVLTQRAEYTCSECEVFRVV